MGFTGSEMLMRRGDPRMVFIRLEKPLVFRNRVAVLESRDSSEYRLAGGVMVGSGRGGVVSMNRSPLEKLADWRRVGVVM